MKAPRLRGRALAALRLAAESPGSQIAIRELTWSQLGMNELRGIAESYRADLPHTIYPLASAGRPSLDDGALSPVPVPTTWPRTADALVAAYRAGSADPVDVAERSLRALADLATRKPCMNLLTRDQLESRTRREAQASRARYAAKAPLGPLDGVPFLVKDEYDVAGLPTRLGSRCEPDDDATEDSTSVARLSAAGAIYLGKTVLTEYGMSPIGSNPNERMPHNAHSSRHAPGGSSTGSSVGVAMGLCPIATAGDGGGSIRIPASLNGIFGIKPTFGRVSRGGDRFWGSVAHCGPVGASTRDLVHYLDAVASSPDPRDPLTTLAPPVSHGFGARQGAGVKGLKIGIVRAEWDCADKDVAQAGLSALSALEAEGAILVDVEMPLAGQAHRIGFLTIGPESLAYHLDVWRRRRTEMADDLRFVFAVLSTIPATEQLDAQRLRQSLRLEAASVLAEVDVLALPTTQTTAPSFVESEEGVAFSDPDALNAMCRYAFLGNLTGLPAATAPVGMDRSGLPIGLQIVGDAWAEVVVLGVLSHLERLGIARAVVPPSAIDLLAG